MRVGLVGARGIGRHHAAWWAAEGAVVCGFAASGPDSLAGTAERLAASHGHAVPGYASVEALLAAQRPDLLDVCSPDALHGAHARMGLEAGCHVLCEKPFLGAAHRDAADLLGEAADLAALASRRGLHLGLCTQYAAGVPALLAACGTDAARAAAGPFEARLASPALGRGPDPVGMWCDLGPHLLSVLARIHPAGEPAWDGLDVDVAPWQVRVAFSLNGAVCVLHAARRAAPPLHLRQFRLGGGRVTLEPETGADGRFAMGLHGEDGHTVHEDFMRVLIRKMRAGGVVNPAATHLREFAWLLHIRDAVRARVDKQPERAAE
jgi:hypothetical protein